MHGGSSLLHTRQRRVDESIRGQQEVVRLPDATSMSQSMHEGSPDTERAGPTGQ